MAKPGSAYTRTAVTLHWGMAALMTAGFALGLYVSDLPGFSPRYLRLVAYHKWIGITVLGLAALRAAWRLLHAAPALPAMPPWQAFAARLTHGLLYALIFVVPLAGWLFSSAKGFPVVYLGLWQLPDLVHKDKLLAGLLGQLHASFAWAAFYVVLLHAAAALKHHFIDHDDTLRRMLRWRRQPAPGSAQ